MDTSGSILDVTFALAVLIFILATAAVSIRGYLRTPRSGTDPGGSAVLGSGIRGWYIAQLQPFEERCIQWRISAAALTYTQAALAVVVAACYAAGMLFTGGWILLVSGTLDVVDGRIARRTHGSSRRGAFLDSIVDRYADGLAFLGLAVFFRDSWVLWATLFALIGGLNVSYARARAEGLGADCRVGFLQRPERYVILGFGTIFGALFDHLSAPWLPPQHHYLVAVVITVLAVLVNATALQRVVYVWRALEGAPHG